jgi:hypothetical protein
MVTIHRDGEQRQMAVALFPCQQVEFPITYLGMPLSTGTLPRSVWQRLIDRIANKLPVWKGAQMNMAGRLALIKSTLSTMPIYTSIYLGLPGWVHKAITKIIKAFLWTGTDVVQSRKCLLAWDRRPKELVGLGILDLRRMGIVLRLRWLWLQRADASRPWSSLPIKEDRLTMAFFRASTQCITGNGRSTYFWTDSWIQGHSVEFMALDLFACLVGRNWHRSTVADALMGNSWLSDICGLLTVPVLVQYIQLHEWVQDLQLNQEVEDSFIWRWSRMVTTRRVPHMRLFSWDSRLLGE